MSTLYLHVGHGKTGSSYIQSSLALSDDALWQQGIVYPRHHSHDRARGGAISSGNGGLLFDQQWRPDTEHLGRDWLFSDENLFQRLITPNFVDQLEGRMTALKIETLSILLFIRDPVDHAQSAYQQSIKRGGKTWSVEAFFDQYNLPRRVKRFLDRYSEGAELTVRNYSRCRQALLPQVESWLGVEKPMIVPPTPVVNRSLTRAELQFQRALNAQLESGSHFVADALCEELPGIKAESVLPAKDVQEAMLSRLADAIESVNQRLQPQHQYATDCFDMTAHSDHNRYELTREQIHVIATQLGQKIHALKSKPGRAKLLR